MEITRAGFQRWIEADRALAMHYLMEGKVQESEIAQTRAEFMQNVMERIIEGGRVARPPINMTEPQSQSEDWHGLAFTRSQWRLILMALNRSSDVLQNEHGPAECAYVQKWVREIVEA
jgi:hypothetical protein